MVYLLWLSKRSYIGLSHSVNGNTTWNMEHISGHRLRHANGCSEDRFCTLCSSSLEDINFHAKRKKYICYNICICQSIDASFYVLPCAAINYSIYTYWLKCH